MPRASRRHGTQSMYFAGCRLDCCRVPASRLREQRKLISMSLGGGSIKVPTVGAIRRLQALRAIGWTLRDISEKGGVPWGSIDSLLFKHRATMTRSLNARVTEAYERMSGTPGPSETTRAKAVRAGWAPPLAWGDDIDDPAATPNGVRQKDTATLDLEDWAYLVRCGEDPARAAERCGVTLSAVERMAHRYGRPELASIAGSARKRWSAA
jgi:hypothetical protein